MYMYVLCIKYVLCKQAYVVCETKDTVTVEISELPCHVAKIIKVLRKFQSSRCSNKISYQFQTLHKFSLVYTGLCQWL
jgi:hypothetical protein